MFPGFQRKRLSGSPAPIFTDLTGSPAPLSPHGGARGTELWLIASTLAYFFGFNEFYDSKTISESLGSWDTLTTHLDLLCRNSGISVAQKISLRVVRSIQECCE